MTDKPTPTDAELNTILCTHWPAFAIQSTLVKTWVRDALKDAIDKWGRPAQAAEPVAWLDPWTGAKVTTDYDAYGKHGIPLVRQQPVVREPLTRQQLREAFYSETACTLGGDADFAEKVCRAVEKAHGIKGGQHGEAKP